MLQADLAILVGAFNADGIKQTSADTGAWDTNALLIDLVEANNDHLEGGAGEDVLFGQRGDDLLFGGGENDFIVGDNATNLSPFKTELPHIYTGIRLIAMDDNAQMDVALDQFGTVITPPMQSTPEELRLNDPFDLPSLWANFVNDSAVDLRYGHPQHFRAELF